MLRLRDLAPYGGAQSGGGDLSDEEEIAELRRRIAELEARRTPQSPTPEAQIPIVAAPKQARGGSVGTAIALLIGAVVLLTALVQCGSPSTTSTTTTSSSTDPVYPSASTSSGSSTPYEPPKQAWRYSDDVDPMNDKHTRMACVTSNDMVSLDSPYEPVTADLCVRNSAKFGLDTFFQLNGSGQILCDSYDGCTGHIRLDDGPRRAISMSTSADHSSEVLFFSSGRSAMNLIAGAKVTRVELTYYQAGSQAVTFNTAELDLSKLGLSRAKK